MQTCTECQMGFFGDSCDQCPCFGQATCNDTINGNGNCSCSNDRLDLSQGCMGCLEPGFDIVSGCTTCLGHLTIESNCRECSTELLDASTSCLQCRNNTLDPEGGCLPEEEEERAPENFPITMTAVIIGTVTFVVLAGCAFVVRVW